MSAQNPFRIGLCMAGAVSAGAYTAGVMDYLIEALEEWQKRKDSGEPDVPSHDIEISIIGGASAGGMTGVVTAAALHDPITPVSIAGDNLLAPIPDNKFYHSWVDLVADNMIERLLDNTDIKKGKIRSALNSDFIDQIAERAIRVKGNHPVERKYISSKLKLFVTLSSLQGMEFSAAFKSRTEGDKTNRYVIKTHRDYACFQLLESENNYEKGGWIPLNFAKKINTELAINAAMATGAFPVGLKSRQVTREGQYLNDNLWFDNIVNKEKGNRPFPDAPVTTRNVDGGMINNEPFDYVRKELERITGHADSKDIEDFNKFKGTVIMVDPFPSEFNIDEYSDRLKKINENDMLTSVVGNVLNALIGQSRVKSETLVNAWDSNKAGQFLISPVRYDGKEAIEGSLAIACGSLGGFGGFLSKEFRIHDYFLGRANCEKFLRDYFTVPFDNNNPIFKEGYSNVNVTKFISTKDGGRQIIPLFTDENPIGPYCPTFSNGKKWPSIKEDFIWSYRKAFKNRIENVILNLAEFNRTTYFFLWAGSKLILSGKLANTIIEVILQSLDRKHRLLEKSTGTENN